MGYSFGPVHYDDDTVGFVVNLLSERNPTERAIELALILKKIKVCDPKDSDGHSAYRRIPMLAKVLRQRKLMTSVMDIILAKFCVEESITCD